MNPVLKAAIESTEITESVEPKEEALIVEDTVAGDETPLILDEIVNKASKTSSDGDLMLDALINLESIHLKFAELGFENMTATGAQFADHAVRTALAPLGIDKPLIASCESFERRPAIATRLSMESIKEQSHQILNGLKELMIKLWNMLKDFFKQLLNGNQFLRSHAEKLKAKAGGVKGSPSKQFIALTERQTRNITDDQGLMQPKDVASLRDYTWYNSLAMSITDGAVAKGVAHIAETMDDFIINGTKDNVGAYVEKFTSVILPVPDIFKDQKTRDGVTEYWSPLMPGMVKFKLTTNNDTDSPVGGINNPQLKALAKSAVFVSARLTVEKSDEKVEAQAQYPVLSIDQINETCESVIKATKWIDELHTHIDRSEQLINRRVESILQHSANKEVADMLLVTVIVRIMSKCETLRAQILMRTATELLAFVRTALQIAEASVALYVDDRPALPAPAA